MQTPDTVVDAAPARRPSDLPVPLVRIDVALVDRLLTVVSRREAVSRRDTVELTAALADVPFFSAEGFVTDLVRWSSHRGDEVIPASTLVDALLDLRRSLTAPTLESAAR
jgi:hypothetical protein